MLSLVLCGLLLLFVVTHVHVDYMQSLRSMSRANPATLFLALAAFYSSFVIRAVRWRVLLRNTNEPAHFTVLFRIIVMAAFANCVLPAKTGDFYRAYLLRKDAGISGSKGLGTIFSERALDFLVLMTLLLLSGFLSFRMTVPHRFLGAFAVGLVVAFGLIGVLVFVHFNAGILTRRLPDRFQERARLFKRGLLSAFQDRLGALLLLSVLVWAAESARLLLVIESLPMHIALNPAQVMFIALVASLLTTIPALPGGLLLVEGGIVAVLVFFGLSTTEGLSVALLDRLISYWSLIAVGILLIVLLGPARRLSAARLRAVRVVAEP